MRIDKKIFSSPPPEIQKILDREKAKEISDYIIRRNRRFRSLPGKETTLNDICKRFKINQKTAKRIFASVDYLCLSSFAYKSPGEGASFGEKLLAAFVSVEWKEAPDGIRIVYTFKEEKR